MPHEWVRNTIGTTQGDHPLEETGVIEMSDDDKAVRLADLEVKRDRTLADLDVVQEARRSTQKSLDGYTSRQDELMQRYIDQLDRDDLPEERRQELYREWNEAFKTSVARFSKLAEEWDSLQVQETILVRMIVELDAQIEELKQELT